MRTAITVAVLQFGLLLPGPGLAKTSPSPAVSCNATGAPPMTTVNPATARLDPHGGRLLQFNQNGVTRYANLNLPREAQSNQSKGRKWPLLIYLHGSRATPESIYRFGKNLFALHDTFPLSANPDTHGFIVLSPEGRRARPAGALTGTGFHWDEWYRDPQSNLDALAVDHFLDETIATGLVDTKRVYVFGWSNGAYMAALYGTWRSDRIAAIAQYAGADPFSREPCPVPFNGKRKVPLVLLRNLCDALVDCATTSQWIATLQKMEWPFAHHNLGTTGHLTAPDAACDGHCGKIKGLYEHIRFPQPDAFDAMLKFLKQHETP